MGELLSSFTFETRTFVETRLFKWCIFVTIYYLKYCLNCGKCINSSFVQSVFSCLNTALLFFTFIVLSGMLSRQNCRKTQGSSTLRLLKTHFTHHIESKGCSKVCGWFTLLDIYSKTWMSKRKRSEVLFKLAALFRWYWLIGTWKWRHYLLLTLWSVTVFDAWTDKKQRKGGIHCLVQSRNP